MFCAVIINSSQLQGVVVWESSHSKHSMPIGAKRIQTDNLLQRARRMAKRSRAAAACLPCKASKAKCSDYRPCARCKKGKETCSDPHSQPHNASLDILVSTYDTSSLSIHELGGRTTSAMLYPHFSNYTSTLAPSIPLFPSSCFKADHINYMRNSNHAKDVALAQESSWKTIGRWDEAKHLQQAQVCDGLS
jgi:hypothetical protein